MTDNRGGAFPRWIAASLACVVAACGARSSLLEGRPAPTANTGGMGGATSTSTAASTTSSTSSSSASSGGIGGAPACLPLTVTGPDLALPAIGGYHARRPAIAELDGPNVALVFGLDAVESPGPVPSPIANVAFDPWGAWPPSMSPPHQVADDGGASFAIATRKTAAYALVASAAPNWLRAALNVDPSGSADLKDVPGLGSPSKGSAVFLAARDDTLMYGFESIQDVPPVHAGGVSVITATDPFTNASYSGACATGALVGDAIPNGGGYLAAMATNFPVLNCLQGLGSGPAVDARIYRGDPNDTPDDILLAHPIERIRVVKRPEGAWLISQTRDFDGNLEPIRADAITDEGHPDPALGKLHPVSGPASGFAAAPFGDGFALAWIAQPASLGVAVYDAKGAALASTTFPLGGPANGPLALVAAPDRSALLVAWSQENPGNAAAMHVARFGCLDHF